MVPFRRFVPFRKLLRAVGIWGLIVYDMLDFISPCFLFIIYPRTLEIYKSIHVMYHAYVTASGTPIKRELPETPT